MELIGEDVRFKKLEISSVFRFDGTILFNGYSLVHLNLQRENWKVKVMKCCKNVVLQIYLYLMLFVFSSCTLALESDPPVLEDISVDKVSVDVSDGPKTVTFTTEITDDTGINWNSTLNKITLKNENNSNKYAYSTNETPGLFTLIFDEATPSGAWDIQFLEVRDTLGNKTAYHYSCCSEVKLVDLGLPASIQVVGGVESDPPVLAAISVNN